jgi:hypothetical protein
VIEVVFRETDTSFVSRRAADGRALGEWEAVALRPVVERDALPGIQPLRVRLTTIREERDGCYHWKTYGRHPGGNRYYSEPYLARAQVRIQQWAQRRFRYAEEVR